MDRHSKGYLGIAYDNDLSLQLWANVVIAVSSKDYKCSDCNFRLICNGDEQR